ncbi:MAG: amidoligase family protein [Clostridia bacterium]
MNTCEFCGAQVEERLTEVEGKHICDNCLEEETFICDSCHGVYFLRNQVSDEHLTICRNCIGERYYRCVECDCLVHANNALYRNEYDDDPYCEDCYNERFRDVVINDYYYKPEPIFYGTGTRYFGVELEIDGAGEDNINARKILEQAKPDTIYLKHDGSLDDGFEIVTHPMTLEYHLEQMKWPEIAGMALALNYTSHKAGTCGLHVHVNKDCFGAKKDEQEKVIAKILYFVEKHWDELLKFSRRTSYQLNRWAKRYGYDEKPSELLEKAKNFNLGRYVSINISNAHTVEFRIFRGTLKLNTILATLQMVNKICDVAFCLSEDEIRELSWTSFVSSITETELITYLKERQIYINEPIEHKEEI